MFKLSNITWQNLILTKWKDFKADIPYLHKVDVFEPGCYSLRNKDGVNWQIIIKTERKTWKFRGTTLPCEQRAEAHFKEKVLKCTGLQEWNSVSPNFWSTVWSESKYKLFVYIGFFLLDLKNVKRAIFFIYMVPPSAHNPLPDSIRVLDLEK